MLPELIEPGKPQQNGRHERMHRTLKDETTRPAAASLAAQQRKFNTFRDEFNQERPHEALDQQTPALVDTSLGIGQAFELDRGMVPQAGMDAFEVVEALDVAA